MTAVRPIPDVPKAELHVHLEAGASPELVRRNAARYGVDVSRLFDDEGRYHWTDFATFLNGYDLAASVFRTPEDFAELTELYQLAAADAGSIYTEFFVSPDFGERTGLGYRAYLDGIIEGIRRAEAATGIVGRVIPLVERHYGPDRGVVAAKAAVDHLLPEVVGFGMAGEERLFEPAEFRAAFAIAAEAGLSLTCHAGEWCSWEGVKATLDAFPVKRIGHGVRAAENGDLLRRIAAEGIHLEVCPVSNVTLGVYESYGHHPLPTLRAAGVRHSLNTDDPPFFWTSVGHEYRVARDAFGFSDEELVGITRMAIEDAFCDEATRARLLTRL
jgi:adenosine deaminase